MLGQRSKDSVHSTTCQFKATLSRLGDGQGVAEVEEHVWEYQASSCCYWPWAMLALFSLGSSQRAQGLLARRGQ